jgi:hypothetical protein
MASSSSHNNGIPLATLLEWYKIRDTFFGENLVFQNIPLALELASACQHPDARWLTEACAGKDANSADDAENIFLSLDRNDARVLCFTWLLGDQEDTAILRLSAELGFAFAQAFLAKHSNGRDRFKFAQLAAAQGERLGFLTLARCFQSGEFCNKDLKKARENFLLASELGDVSSMIWLGTLLEDYDVQRWRWWGRAAALGARLSFLQNFAAQVELFNSGAGSDIILYAIGRALHGHVDEVEGKIFNDDYNFDSLIDAALQADEFYDTQIKACRKAIDCWTMVAKRFGVVKDIRRLIANMIWETRDMVLFKK